MELNKKHNLPSVVKFQYIFSIISFVFLISLLIGFFGGQKVFINAFWIFLILSLPLMVYIILYIKFFSFIVSEEKITINYGIIIKHSNTILFRNIQSVEGFRNIPSMIFGTSNIKIWTASPEQIRNSRNQKPSGDFLLKKDDTDWLREFISSKHN
jgi:uncharacterized membrane protein YdbT with pleckstrin-like domain